MLMPFTPFHLGPAVGFGLPLQKYLHAPTFIIANVIVDVEPFVVLVLGLQYPLHGYLHTFLLAIIVGLVFGYTMRFLEPYLHRLYGVFLLEANRNVSLTSFVLAGVLGAVLHVLLDAPLYSNIRPLYPLAANPLYNPALSVHIYSFCVWMGLISVAYYIGFVTFWVFRRKRTRL
jgi:hypothetical protein